MTPEEEVVILRSILRRARGSMWWARLSYPDDPKFWNADERAVLSRLKG